MYKTEIDGVILPRVYLIIKLLHNFESLTLQILLMLRSPLITDDKKIDNSLFIKFAFLTTIANSEMVKILTLFYSFKDWLSLFILS